MFSIFIPYGGTAPLNIGGRPGPWWTSPAAWARERHVAPQRQFLGYEESTRLAARNSLSARSRVNSPFETGQRATATREYDMLEGDPPLGVGDGETSALFRLMGSSPRRSWPRISANNEVAIVQKYRSRGGQVMREFVGKTAFVTGGASGIGLALGRAFAEAGCKVMLADIEKAALDAAVVLCQEGARAPCCRRDEGGPFGAVL